VEPEESAVQQSKPLDQRIAAPSVLTLVRQYDVELRLRPLMPLFRENHHWADEYHSHRRGAQSAGANAVVDHRFACKSARADGAYRQPKKQQE